MPNNINELIAQRICERNGIERCDGSSWLETLAWESMETGDLIDNILHARKLLEPKPKYELWDFGRMDDTSENVLFIGSFDSVEKAFPHVVPHTALVRDGYEIVLFHEDDFETIHQWRCVAPWHSKAQ